MTIPDYCGLHLPSDVRMSTLTSLVIFTKCRYNYLLLSIPRVIYKEDCKVGGLGNGLIPRLSPRPSVFIFRRARGEGRAWERG